MKFAPKLSFYVLAFALTFIAGIGYKSSKQQRFKLLPNRTARSLTRKTCFGGLGADKITQDEHRTSAQASSVLSTAFLTQFQCD